MPLVYLNGRLVASTDALVSVFDHGLVVGDGVFETVLLRNQQPFALSRHLDRLERSAAGLCLQPVNREEVTRAVEEVVRSAEFPLGRIRITYTAGEGPLGSGRLDSPATLVVACSEEAAPHPHCSVAITPWSRNEHGALSGLKTTSYAENALALHFAHEHGADEAIFANTAGMCCEGTGSNIFVVIDGELCTPPLTSGCLAGVTRALVLEHVGAAERDFPISALRDGTVEEAFLTSTLRGVQPVRQVDGRDLARAPGPVSVRAAACYDELLEEIGP
jgi:branched-chain amino acid aminotransferase